MRSSRPRPRPAATSTIGRIVTRWAISMSATICPESGEVGINLSGSLKDHRSQESTRRGLLECPSIVLSRKRRFPVGRRRRIRAVGGGIRGWTAWGHMGLRFGLLAVVLLLLATALALRPPRRPPDAGFTW